MTRECQVLRVFTREEDGGNHLGVVTDLTGLTPESMQEIATDLGFSETIFCDLAGEVPTARIFTPATELPFAGHPLVGLGWALNNTLPDPVDRIRCQVGDITVNFEGLQTWIKGTGNQPVDPIDDSPLGGEVAVTVLMPVPYMVVQFSTPRQIAEFVPPPSSLGDVYVWAWEDPGRVAKVRFFADEAGVPEDPATGSGAFALASYFRSIGQTDGSIVIHQGDEIGHPSTIRLRWDAVNSSIGGTVVHDEVRTLDI